jgi:hypothetical protein
VNRIELNLDRLPDDAVRRLFDWANRLGISPQQAVVLALKDAARRDIGQSDVNYGVTAGTRVAYRRRLLEHIEAEAAEADLCPPNLFPAAMELRDRLRAEIAALEVAAEPLAASPDDENHDNDNDNDNDQ